jgi:predicted Kef-type K+ transport protein
LKKNPATVRNNNKQGVCMLEIFSAIDYREPLWLGIAFLFGLGSRFIGLPPLVGFLVAGFALNIVSTNNSTEFISEIANHGVTLLLFTIGLKLRLRSLFRPEIWGVAMIHIPLISIILGSIALTASLLTGNFIGQIDLEQALLIGFALSFSSTVFVVKVLEANGEVNSRFGQIAIGILIMQDLAAVGFLVFTAGKIPSIWALGLLLLIPLRPLLFYVLEKVGHGELLILYGIVLALGSSSLFELVGMKGDLGALIVGAMMANHPKGKELAKSLFAFKEIFLIGFFLAIGQAGIPTVNELIVALALVLLIPFKMGLFYVLLTGFRVRLRNAWMSSSILANYSEFGLIVIAAAVGVGMLDERWLITMAIAVSFSFVVSILINRFADQNMLRWKAFLKRFEHDVRLPEDEVMNFPDVRAIVFGMGRVGSALYERMQPDLGDALLGIDFDKIKVYQHLEKGRHVITGDPTDMDFWDRVGSGCPNVSLIVLAMSNHTAHLTAAKGLRARGYEGSIVAAAYFPDEIEELEDHGVDAAFNVAAEVGRGLSEDIKLRYPGMFHPH